MSALSNRDANTQMNTQQSEAMNVGKKVTAAAGGENKKQTLEQRIAEQNLNGKQSGTYVSPSDAILSPASQKLAGFKQRQINKQNTKNPTARSLFSRTASTVSGGSLEDAEDAPSKQQ